MNKLIKKVLGLTHSKEHWFNNIVYVYYVPLSLKSFKIGLILGTENCLYLGFFCIGLDFDLYR